MERSAPNRRIVPITARPHGSSASSDAKPRADPTAACRCLFRSTASDRGRATCSAARRWTRVLADEPEAVRLQPRPVRGMEAGGATKVAER